jgi:hypothetical protein
MTAIIIVALVAVLVIAPLLFIVHQVLRVFEAAAKLMQPKPRPTPVAPRPQPTPQGGLWLELARLAFHYLETR